MTSNGMDYLGTMAYSESGKKCLQWKDITHHELNIDHFLERYLVDVKNYCRNPGGYGERPWCYTDDSELAWEYCDISQCHDGKFHINHVQNLHCKMLT